MRPTRGMEFRVGLFVAAALAIGGALIFVIGNQKNIFRSKSDYYAIFNNVGGLRPGAPVRIAGVDVGTVGRVTLGNDGKIRVALDIVDSYAPLVKRGGKASVGNKGMLGDRLVDITVGNGDVIPTGGRIDVDEGRDLFAAATEMSGTAREVLNNVRTGTEALKDPEFGRAILRATQNLERVTAMLANNQGIVQRMMTDEQLAGRIDHTLAQVDAATTELARTARSVRAITEQVEHGHGTAHDVIYGDSGARLTRNLADATNEVAQILREVRTGDGTLHDVIYEDEADQLLANLTAISTDVRAVTADVRAGRGTLGGLLVDPSIYEDVKRLVGNLERNEILRALVRYSIRQDDARPAATVTPRQ